MPAVTAMVVGFTETAAVGRNRIPMLDAGEPAETPVAVATTI